MRCVSLGFCDTSLFFFCLKIFFIGKQNIKHIKTLGIEITAKMDDGIPGHSLPQSSHHLFSPTLQGLCLSLFGLTEILQSRPNQATNHSNLSCIEVLIQSTTLLQGPHSWLFPLLLDLQGFDTKGCSRFCLWGE